MIRSDAKHNGDKELSFSVQYTFTNLKVLSPLLEGTIKNANLSLELNSGSSVKSSCRH